MFITRPNPANIKQKYATTWEKIYLYTKNKSAIQKKAYTCTEN